MLIKRIGMAIPVLLNLKNARSEPSAAFIIVSAAVQHIIMPVSDMPNKSKGFRLGSDM